MRHLTPDELIDVAEGTRTEASAPHLQTCGECRAQVADLRVMMARALESDVPEPSPLFWDHLSARVRDAVAAEGAPPLTWFGWLQSGLMTPLSAVGFAVIVLAVAVTFGVRHMPGASAPSPAGAVADIIAIAQPGDDASLDMVADLASQVDQVDWEAAGDASLGVHGHEDAAEKAATQLSAGERRELGRLLQKELAHTGN
jgi:hypothetical protein